MGGGAQLNIDLPAHDQIQLVATLAFDEQNCTLHDMTRLQMLSENVDLNGIEVAHDGIADQGHDLVDAGTTVIQNFEQGVLGKLQRLITPVEGAHRCVGTFIADQAQGLLKIFANAALRMQLAKQQQPTPLV